MSVKQVGPWPPSSVAPADEPTAPVGDGESTHDLAPEVADRAAEDGAPQDGAPEDAGAAAATVIALSVAGAARGLGVAPGTLRSWERRYGLGPSAHTAGGHRRYGPVDLARLGYMHRLVQEGVPPAEAAAAAIRAPIDPAALDPTSPYSVLIGSPPGDSPATGEVGEGEQVEAAGPTESGVRPLQAVPVGGGRVLSTPSRPRSVRGLARAAMALDSAACHRTLAASLAERGVLETWEELARPVMGAIGDRWQQTGRGVEIEHTFSAVLLAALSSYAARLEQPRNGRPPVLASVPDELHDLPLFVLLAALAEVGIRAHLLGARTPPEALADAVERLGPPLVFLWAQMPDPRLPELPPARPAPALVLGGPGWGAVPEGAQRVVDLGGAVGAVRATMGF